MPSVRIALTMFFPVIANQMAVLGRVPRRESSLAFGVASAVAHHCNPARFRLALLWAHAVVPRGCSTATSPPVRKSPRCKPEKPSTQRSRQSVRTAGSAEDAVTAQEPAHPSRCPVTVEVVAVVHK